jgi:hypothetical protein
MITKYEMHKLIDDLKRIARIIPILRDETNKKQRERLGQLALDELQKLTDDLSEMKENGKNIFKKLLGKIFKNE